MTDPQKDDHIEELLGKLQGIFGKLSHSEEEEAKQKIEIPLEAPKEPAPKETTAETPESPPPPAPPPDEPSSPTPLNLYSEPEPEPAPEPAPVVEPPPAAPVAAAAPPQAGNYESTVSLGDPERTIIPTAIYFPPGREAEAKSLAQKLETMTPKFTKVAFRLRVCVFLPYDPKSDWKGAILLKSAEIHFKTVFVVMERPLEDAKRKPIAAELEGHDIYFQEITLASIEKKAIYTDILLGLVFFFDSRKPAAGAEES